MTKKNVHVVFAERRHYHYHLPGGPYPPHNLRRPTALWRTLCGKGPQSKPEKETKKCELPSTLNPGGLEVPLSRRGLPGELPVRSDTGSRDKSPVSHRRGSGLPWASSG